MEFWGVEIKGDKPVKVLPNADQVVHLSQAVLADLKKSETVTLYAKIGGQKLVIGLLSADKFPQLSFDLVFDREVELSHNLKNGTVHLTGYKSIIPDELYDNIYFLDSFDSSSTDDDDDDFSMFSEEEAPALEALENGVVAAAAASKAKPVAPVAKKDNKPKEDSDDDDEEDDSDDDSSDGDSDEAMGDDLDSLDGSDEDSSDEEEETPVKSAGNKKRPASASKTPETKKAKIITPQKTDGGKKSAVGHVATPHPAKNAKSPKSGGAQVTCGPCKKSFNSQGALDSHTKAKHSATK